MLWSLLVRVRSRGPREGARPVAGPLPGLRAMLVGDGRQRHGPPEPRVMRGAAYGVPGTSPGERL